MKRLHLPTLLLLALIAGLGYFAVEGQRREARLRAALAAYQARAGKDLDWVMGIGSWPGWTHSDEIRLGDLVRWIRDLPQASRFFPRGVPVVVDPEGLREAGQTLDSLITAMPEPAAIGEVLTLRRRLQFMLEPLGLAAEARGGAIVITSRSRAREESGPVGRE